MQSDITAAFEAYVSASMRTLRDLGLTIRWGDDFDLFARIIERSGERYAPSPGFDPKARQGRDLDGLWLVAFDRGGKLVHTQAARCVDIRPDLVEHLRTCADAYEPAYLPFDLDDMDVTLSPSASRLSGRTVYHGEAWLKPGPNGIRGGAYLYIFSRMMIAQALARWRTDHVMGLITHKMGSRGLASRYGYMRCEQGAVVFNPHSPKAQDLWLVWMTAEEARCQMRLQPDYFVRTHMPVAEPMVEGTADRVAKVA